MARTAARAVVMDLPVTAPMRQPRSCNWRPSARPTRPAPTMDKVSDICCVSITCLAIFALRTFSFCTISGLHVFGLIASLWVVQGIRAGIGMSRLPWLRDAHPFGFSGCAFAFHYLCGTGRSGKAPRGPGDAARIRIIRVLRSSPSMTVRRTRLPQFCANSNAQTRT